MIWLKYSSVSPRINVIDVCVLLLGMVVVLESVMMGLCVMLALNLLVRHLLYSSNGKFIQDAMCGGESNVFLCSALMMTLLASSSVSLRFHQEAVLCSYNCVFFDSGSFRVDTS
jgi:hypothetical protein